MACTSWKWRTISRIRTTSVSVEGSSSSRRCSSGSAAHSSARISAYSADLVGKCLNSRPSEMEAAAATLLVVVPAKPLRAKQRLAALNMSCRRRSLVMRKVLTLVSKHSPYQKSTICCSAFKWTGLNRPESECAADAGHDEGAVAAGEHALEIRAVDLDAGEARPAGDVLHAGRKCLDVGHGRDRAGVRYPASLGDADQIDGRRGMARLAAGLAVDLVIQHHDGEIFGFLQANGRQTSHPHQHFAVACDDDHRQVRLRQRYPQPDHDRAAHGAPQIKVAVVIAGGGDIVGRGAQAADHDRILALRQQAGNDAATLEKVGFAHLVKTFAPIRRCDNRTAVGVQAL